jgi:Domain of unknown function (DUF4412)
MKSKRAALTMRFVALVGVVVIVAQRADAFEGRITASLVRGEQTNALLYTVSTNALRIEVTGSIWPTAVNIVPRNTGALTLLFPHNRSFVRLKPVAGNTTAPAGFPAMSQLPPGIGPQTLPSPPSSSGIGPSNRPGMPKIPGMPQVSNRPQMPPGVGPQSAPGVPAMPALPGMPMPPMLMPGMIEKMELRDTGRKTNLLGFACEQYEIKQRGEIMEIWATDQLLPFQPYLPSLPQRFGPRPIQEQWGELLKARKLFPLLAVLRFETPSAPGHAALPPGPERMRFEVRSFAPEKITDDTLFQPPPDYHEIQPLPF